MQHLNPSEFEMFSFFELTPDLVCIAGKDGYFKKVNPAVIKTLGYSREELFSQPISTYIHPDDADLTRGERLKLINGKALVNFRNRYVAKNENVVWLEWTSIFVPDKEVVFAIAKDITDRRQKELEIEEKFVKFKTLASHFKNSVENDRRYLSFELHEEMAQLASIIKMDVDWIRTHEKALSSQSNERVDHAIRVSELLIDTIRRVSFSVSPKVLQDVGLNAALEWQCQEFSLLNGIPCIYEYDYEESHLTSEIKLDFFRICQEALSNVMHHAGAKNASVSINSEGENITLCIADDGKGFSEKVEMASPGLTAMQNRLSSINGRLKIESEPGIGTKIYATVKNPGIYKIV